MAVTDPIANMLTIVRNGSRVHKEKVDLKKSRINEEILKIFKKEGYIKNFRVIDDKRQGMIRAYLKYEKDSSPIITQIKRISKPGLRIYVNKEKVPKVLNGLGIAVISTSRGIMTDRDAKKEKVGGEVLCYIW